MPKKRQAIVLPMQTTLDIAIREYGSVEGVFDVLRDNPQLVGIGADLQPGQLLKVLGAPIDVDVVEFFRQRDARPVTGPLMLPDPCEGYPCMPEFVTANMATTPVNQPFLEATPSLPVGNKYLVHDLDMINYNEGDPIMPETTSLFARNTGNIMEWRGYGDTGGVEGSPWNVITLPPGSVVAAGVGMNQVYKVWPAANGAALYPTGKFTLRWLPPPFADEPSEIVKWQTKSYNTETHIAHDGFSPCRYVQLERAPYWDEDAWEPVGERRTENSDGPWPDLTPEYWYRNLWTTGPADAQCVQGHSGLIIVF